MSETSLPTKPPNDESKSPAPSPRPNSKPRGPRDPRLVRIGLYIALAGFLFAMVMAAILGFLGTAGTHPVLENIHRFALTILLGGMLLVLYGYVRLDESKRQRFGGLQWKRLIPPTGRNATSAILLVVGFLIAFIIFSVLLLCLAAGFDIWPLLLGSLLIPAAIFFLAYYAPDESRPFYLAANFPGACLLLLDILLIKDLILLDYDVFRSRASLGYFDHRIIVAHIVAFCAIPLCGWSGWWAESWFRQMRESTPDAPGNRPLNSTESTSPNHAAPTMPPAQSPPSPRAEYADPN